MALLFKIFCRHNFNVVKSTALFNNLRSRSILFINHTGLHSSNSLKIITPLNSKPPFNLNTSVIKDVILYKYENPRQFTMMNIFAITQFAFWLYLSHFAYFSLKNVPVSTKEDAPWWRKINFGEGKYRNTITYGSFVLGWLVLACAWYYTLRSVRYLILRKGGKSISIVTYSPLGHNRIMEVPLEKISATQSRVNSKVHLPLKVENRTLHYLLDMKGEFLNPMLFDFTAGLNRKFHLKTK